MLLQRTVVRPMPLERNNLTKAQTTAVAAIEERLPDLVEVRDVVENFHDMLRRKPSGDLEVWIERAVKSLVASFANGVIRDRAAIQKAITSQWSNGHITKLKLIERGCTTAGNSIRLRRVSWEPPDVVEIASVPNPLGGAARWFLQSLAAKKQAVGSGPLS